MNAPSDTLRTGELIPATPSSSRRTRYIAAALTAPRIHRSLIPRGYRGTQTTVARMRGLIREGAKDFYVRQHAIDILIARSVPAKDYEGEIRALFEWVQQHVRYTRDPSRPRVFTHVYIEAWCRGRWIPLDATMPYPMGWAPRAPVKKVIHDGGGRHVP
jgi:hypothetical protein